MTLAVFEDYLAVSNGLIIDIFNGVEHQLVEYQDSSQNVDQDIMCDLKFSFDGKYLAAITNSSKRLLIYDTSTLNIFRVFDLPRSASRIRFTANNDILIADKTGDALIYSLIENKARKLLGHLSLLLDILLDDENLFVVTCDRDEKIRITSYSDTYRTHSYCLGHKEFVNNIDLLPHNKQYLVSSSGDGTIKIWKYKEGVLCHSINTMQYVDKNTLIQFVDSMQREGLETEALPIVSTAIQHVNENNSILAVALYSYNEILIFDLLVKDSIFIDKLIQRIPIENPPKKLIFSNMKLYAFCDIAKPSVLCYSRDNSNEEIFFKVYKTIKMFSNASKDLKQDLSDAIKVLYKRKFDNVQEYHERKKQRLQLKS